MSPYLVAIDADSWLADLETAVYFHIQGLNSMVRTLNLICIVFCGLACGCGPESNMATVTGNVTIDGTPAENGSISFIPVDGMSSTAGASITNGKFTSEAPIGESKVEIRVPKVVGKKKLYDTPESPIQNVMAEVLPAKYNESTELRFTAQKGKNEKNFELSAKKQK